MKRLIYGFVLSGALLLPLALPAPNMAQNRAAVRQGRQQVRTDRQAAVNAPVGSKFTDRQAARQERQTIRPERRDLRQDRRAMIRRR
ncbi:MAG: hypothetical protein C5B51_15800 [Terriglobia bacterium]|nr:MAG: hypothetical protein C5B51_15800 [Terriglobia bacterium]